MVEKKSPAEGWPVVNGDYIVGDPESPVAATTLASHIEDIPVEAGAAIAGPCKTENLGIEKMIANLISNPNIRFLILCGSEVQGHITGQSIEALHQNGVDPDKRNIIGATGAIPYIENIPDEGIERFQKQLEIVNLIDVEDADAIKAKVKECIEKDPGAFEEEAMIIKVEEGGEEEEGEEVKPVAPETALIEARMRNIQTQVKMIGSTNRMFAGMYSGKVQGIMIGLAFTLTLGILLLV
ncbi:MULTISPECIES: tetrahydromethanopterin S-methyltransferase subunit A [Methanothermobacter]|uniref:Tetrahydromethanopterin S-methyltransferase subunit A 1 n=1 Tax=Methanothermobacter marburgensis (strain ATCC BAA-927 / DSM 2133 / JCM 14651 / NBRC 100331 / OCM 82 / Marburg) TaxID=79929 RepID=MTRA1_METTM|nr:MULTISPECIES: tetrahydromethanopterin S-methyltransferase subunit A [Methanothermobacter]P80184.3 RecName: Full=Tetrahydromethanopterin S-methyltransferase subunit A 1; AltName: Full=N5-methyltetrahydromethanopterin--coenzyme M methyltransferase subunit A 1 [Methanothermobacter marburgensis str. Marburg]pir/S38369/ tetrahydromethanopterin S-methyltransferase (EC 2.1.1.86) chain A mtrA [validated] - Methanobacterium thermoautotrophicum (strain Marburg) [Methanothermobacter thermautotrophicus]M